MTETSKGKLWTGRVLSALVALFLAFSGVMKFAGGQDVVDGFAHLGLPLSMRVPLGVLELAVVVLYAIPATSVLGAILVAGYMGGAIVTHWRLGEPVFMQIALGVVAWLGVWLREPRLRAILPLRTRATA
jgi:hypothetical protein